MRQIVFLLLIVGALSALTACSSTNPPENELLFQEFRIFEDDANPQKT